MTTRFHTTASGHRIEYEATPKVETFLRRLHDLATDRDVSTQEMTGIAYSTENPILDHTMFPGRGAVTREVLDNPAYGVVTDLLFRKQLAEQGTTPDKIAEKYSMTVADAALELGIHESAVRQAIAAKRLASWLKNGRHYVDPRALKTLEVGTRGPTKRAASAGSALKVRLGNKPGASLSVRAPAPLVGGVKDGANTKTGEIAPGWRKVVVRLTMGGEKHSWVIAPGSEENELGGEGLFIRGRFKVIDSADTAKKADSIWKFAEVE